MRGLCAQDIMSRAPLITLKLEQSIYQLLNYLELYPHLADYPVVDSSRGGIVLGIIRRSDILTLLIHRGLFYEKPQVENGHYEGDSVSGNGHGHCDSVEIVAPSPHLARQRRNRQRRVTLKFEELIHEKVKKVDIDLDTVLKIATQYDRDKQVLDVTPYVEIGHYTVNRFVSVHRTFELFRSFGLRDLVVTDAFGRPMGVITWHDLKLLEEVGIGEAYYASRHDSMDEIDGVYQDLRERRTIFIHPEKKYASASAGFFFYKMSKRVRRSYLK